MSTYLVPYVVVPDDASEAVYAAVRNGADDEIVTHLLQQGFEATDTMPGWTSDNGWSLFIRRLFTVEAE